MKAIHNVVNNSLLLTVAKHYSQNKTCNDTDNEMSNCICFLLHISMHVFIFIAVSDRVDTSKATVSQSLRV